MLVSDVVYTIGFFTKFLRRLMVFLTDFVCNHFLDELRLAVGGLIVKIFAAVITADFTLNPQAVLIRVIFAIHIELGVFLVIDVDTELFVHIEPCLDISGNLPAGVAVYLHIPINGKVVFFELVVFCHTAPPLILPLPVNG